MQCVFLNTKIKSSKYHFAIELYLHITALPAINDITCVHTTALHALHNITALPALNDITCMHTAALHTLHHITCIALLAEVSVWIRRFHMGKHCWQISNLVLLVLFSR